MFLKKIEISGFKSFAARTTLDFLIDSKNGKNYGITTIVGPNGSGKSNIADAIRWAMGEQSMKNLRSKKSEDIIFAGSGKKARLGSALVTLYFDNSDKKIPIEFEEVAISRKIFRSGESEYLINGSRVRLQDVIDILAKAGVGKEGYSIINQGMADSVLNATPSERRLIIEDAAGVKQYQIKKERAIRKLESTRQNLERVKELVEEIRPHVKMLKRQADRAAQGEKVERELLEKQTELFSHLWHNFRKEKEKLEEKKEEIGRRMMNIQREADKLSDEIDAESKKEENKSQESELEKRARILRNKLNELERDLIITEGRIEIEKEKQKNIQVIEEINSSELKPVDLSYVRAALEEIRKEQEKLIERMEKVERLEDLQEVKEFARVIQQKLYDLKNSVEEGKREKNSGNKPAVSETAVDSEILRGLEEKIAGIRAGIKKSEDEIKETGVKIQKETAVYRERRQAFFEMEREFRTKQEKLGKLKDEYNDSKIDLARVEVREEDLRSEVKREIKMNADELKPETGEINRENYEKEIIKLKVKMEQIGGIDPMVIQEYEETDKRFNFLTGESADLEKAIMSLREIIKEMDQKIEKEFEATYGEINKGFAKYFKIIFGGGQAHLIKKKEEKRKKKTEEILEDNSDTGNNDSPDEVVGEEVKEEIGIDIYANPPGKRISHLSMLSGGERSLASIALLFAIISYNPPPFAVLDEVEAALDEANSKRFGRILTELSNDTQFVIITHNRETMRQAALLYGVTMGEDGISKLLSVRMDQIGREGKIIKKIDN